MLRVARRIPGLHPDPEFPHLETLLEEESVKVKDGYHYARWITPLSGLFLALACFLPLALTVHPLFWIGAAGSLAIGTGLGYGFHLMAQRISPTQVLLRQRCMKLSQRLIAMRSLLGVLPTLSPPVAEFLDEAAAVYLRARPRPQEEVRTTVDRASIQAHRAMEEAMAQMLALAEPESPQAQQVELGRGWAQPLLAEMKATALALNSSAMRGRVAELVESPASPLAGLRDARSDLERLESAAVELDEQTRHERA